ncbi:MAG: hypothetical protein ABJP45_09920, partial [Cyclobacteriaceae bacterium]
ELERLVAIQQTGDLEEIRVFGANSVQQIADIAVKVLKAEIAQKQSDFVTAEALLLEAVIIEDGLSYQEPPDWFFSVRHMLGDLYLERGKIKEAVAVYQKDLTIFPKNGFALNGLYHAFTNLGMEEEAGEIKVQFEKSWEFADSELRYSRIDKEKRKNLALRILPDSPGTLIYLAGNFCGNRQ